MAEKEERIYVRKYGENNPCDTCEDKFGVECDFCVKNYEWNASITRQEAIDRMAKGLHKESTRISNMEKDFDKLPAGWRKSFYNYAEAALNALLK